MCSSDAPKMLNTSVELTIGDDSETIAQIEIMGNILNVLLMIL